jgi:hypothetical protein
MPHSVGDKRVMVGWMINPESLGPCRWGVAMQTSSSFSAMIVRSATRRALDVLIFAVVAQSAIASEVTTRFEWMPRDGGIELDWHAAEKYCRELTHAGHADWRLPEIDELAALYEPSVVAHCGDEACHLRASIELTSPFQWSATRQGETRRFYFDFRFGTRLSPLLRPTLTRGALCVRSGRIDVGADPKPTPNRTESGKGGWFEMAKRTRRS